MPATRSDREKHRVGLPRLERALQQLASRCRSTDLQPRFVAVVKDFSPAYFAMVMATGIVSLAAFVLKMTALARVLFAVNMVAYPIIAIITMARMACYPRAFFSDMVDHQRGPGFLTFVAASCVLGSQFVVINANYEAAVTLWMASAVFWIVLIYAVFAAFSVKERKPTLADGINGGWLLAVVSTQSIAVLGALIAAHWPQPYRLELNFLALSMWLWGGMLYIWMIALIFYRYTFFDFSPGGSRRRIGSTWERWQFQRSPVRC